jgi:hypothetical protein
MKGQLPNQLTLLLLPLPLQLLVLPVLLLSPCRGTGEVVHLEEEFRLLTLQVIGEAILSLPPEECDRVRGS